jgi:hypothetical protein
MKKTKYLYSKLASVVFALLLFTFVGCERELSEDAVFAEFSRTAEVFTDAPIGMGTDFYFPYGGSKATAWTVDNNESYLGNASMRFDVPNANDPEGNFAGAIFRIDGVGRNLTTYDALTFWAKASQNVTIGEAGFGEDFGENRYLTTLNNIDLTTNWKKYVIPIPDASKLIGERGMFRYSAGGVGAPGSELGYTFWIDELKFENLGTVAQPRPAILNGVDEEEIAFLNNDIQLTGLTQTFNIASGENVTVQTSPAYYDFESTDIEVARVSELGVVSIVGRGVAEITAFIAGVRAQGSLTLDSTEDFEFAPIPTRNANDVISIFSDVYSNVPVDFYNGFWEPFQTTLSADFSVNGDNILAYTNFNFVGNQFANPTIDATEKSNLHINMFIPAEIPADLDFLVTVVDFGADNAEGGGDDTREQYFFFASDFEANTWATLEIPLTFPNRSNIGLIIYENINNTSTSSIESFYLDNIYFYRD